MLCSASALRSVSASVCSFPRSCSPPRSKPCAAAGRSSPSRSLWLRSSVCSPSTSCLGAPLQLNTLFGYSTAVAGRFAGLGNLAFGFFAAATLLLAISAYEGLPRRWALPAACGVLVLGVLVDGLPMLGGDVGGVLAMVPAFGITAMVLTGRTLRVRHVVAWFAIGGATVLAFGLHRPGPPAR